MPRSRTRSRSPKRPARDLGPEVEAFLRAEPEIEERAAVMLRSKGPEVQRLVLARGGLSATRNPTAVLISRIRNAEEGLRPVLETERAPEEIERFLVIERVEPHAAARLRRASRVVQQAVVSRGSLAGTRDPTAVLMTRIRDAEKEHAPSTDPLLAITQAAQAASEAADPFGSDPQAYALAYYAQYQAAYPQAVQSAFSAGYGGYGAYGAAAATPTAGATDPNQVVQVQGLGGMESIQLPPGYQLYPVGVANPDGTIGALPAGFSADGVATAPAGSTALATQPGADGGMGMGMGMSFPSMMPSGMQTTGMGAFPNMTGGMSGGMGGMGGMTGGMAGGMTGGMAGGMAGSMPGMGMGQAGMGMQPAGMAGGMAGGFPGMQGMAGMTGMPQMGGMQGMPGMQGMTGMPMPGGVPPMASS